MATLTHIDSTECQGVNENDFLFVIDMQNDFIPPGPCGVIGGDEIIGDICQLISLFDDNGGHIILTRDYHPPDHQSLIPNGPFNSHCVWGSDGSQITLQIIDQIRKCRHQENICVAYKAVHPLIDSYGALPYGEEYECMRLGTTNSQWTGGIIFPQLDAIQSLFDYPEKIVDFTSISNTRSIGDFSQNIDGRLLSDYMQEHTQTSSNFYLSGLAGDFCVLDTAINLHQLYPIHPTIIVRDCVRYIQEPNSFVVLDIFEQNQVIQ
jgi:nicotinamidase-related amidase